MNERMRKWALSSVAVVGMLVAGASAWGQRAQASGRAGSYRVADLFGESEEEKQARILAQQHEDAQDASVRYLRQRDQDLESAVRGLTGQLEDLDHRITELNTRIERMQKDFDYRLCKVAAMQLSASGDQAPVPCMGGQSQVMGTPSLPPSGAPPAGGVLAGTPIHLTPPPAASSPPPSVNRARFDAAMKLLTRTQYDEARSAFRSFADAYPNDELAPQAVYWFGDIAYVQKDYSAAARAFAEEIKKYPDSARAPDSMFKLGQSLIAINQKQEGCTALAALPTKYPNASKTVLDRAAQERKAAKCR